MTKGKNISFSFKGLYIGVIAVLIFYAVTLILKGQIFSWQNIVNLHKSNLAYFIIDSLPFANLFVAYYFSILLHKREQELLQQIEIRNKEIDTIANYTMAIGNEEFDAPVQFDAETRLGKAMLEMRENLIKNRERELHINWKNEGKQRIITALRNHINLKDMSYDVLKNIIEYLGVVQGAFYIYEDEGEYQNKLHIAACHAYNRKKYHSATFGIGEGLVGQAAIEKKFIHRTEIPDDYLTITSGILGEKKPNAILIAPLFFENNLQGAIEIAGNDKFTDDQIELIEDLAEIIARTIFNLKVTERTERLLKESQEMTTELQEKQIQLEENAVLMEEKKEQIEKANSELELKIKEVEHSQQRQHALLENASEVITIYDKDFNVKYESPSVQNILGYTEEEMMSTSSSERIKDEDLNRLKQMLERLSANPELIEETEVTYRKKDGEVIYLEVIGKNLLSDPAIEGIIVNSRDITSRKVAEKEQEMRGKMQALSENSQDVIIRFDIAGNFLYANPRMKSYYGISSEEALNTNIFDHEHIHPDIKDCWSSIIKDTEISKSITNVERTYSFEDREDFTMKVTAIPEFNSAKNVETVLVVAHDITVAKKQEEAIKKANKKITDSINYAKRIQNAIIPSSEEISKDLKENFMLYIPKDVVSGDFPWYYKKGEYIYIAAVDCTGHGVPGAMMSLIGFLLLNDIVNGEEVLEPGEVLNRLHWGVVNTLKQDVPGNLTNDGMDVSLCRIHLPSNELQYSGAHRPLYLLRNGEVEQFKGDKYPIGGNQYKGANEFSTHTINLEKGDSVYFFSDGYPDQFGGPEKLKYGPKRMRKILMKESEKSMTELKEVYEKEFYDWKGDEKQMDDVLLIGIQF